MAQAIQVGNTSSAPSQASSVSRALTTHPFDIESHCSFQLSHYQAGDAVHTEGEWPMLPYRQNPVVLQSALLDDVQAANMTAVFNNSQLNATVFVPNDDAIRKVTAANNITVDDLYNNPLDVLMLVRWLASRMLPLIMTVGGCLHRNSDWSYGIA